MLSTRTDHLKELYEVYGLSYHQAPDPHEDGGMSGLYPAHADKPDTGDLACGVAIGICTGGCVAIGMGDRC